MRFTFEIEGSKEFDRAFNRVGDHIKDLRPIWDEVERVFYQIEKEQFGSEGSKGRGGQWKALSRPYAKRKAQKYGAMPILRATRRMEKALTGKTGDTEVLKTKDEFAIGTSLFYPAFHQTGTSKMPKREVVSFADDQRRFLQKEMQKSLLKIIKGDRVITRSVEIES